MLQQDAHDTTLTTQFDDTVEFLRNALARMSELEHSAQSDSLKIGAELGSVKVLLQKSEENGRSLEGSLKEAQERLAVERVKVQEKQEEVEEEQGRLKEMQEQLIQEQDKTREANEGLSATIQKLNEANGRLEAIEKELEQARRGKSQQVGGVLKELEGAMEESEALKAECGKLRREKDRLQVGLHSAKQCSPTCRDR